MIYQINLDNNKILCLLKKYIYYNVIIKIVFGTKLSKVHNTVKVWY